MKFKVISCIAAFISVLFAAGIMALCWIQYQSSLMLWLLGVAAIVSLPLCSFFHEIGHVLFGLFSKVHAKISWSSVLVFFKSSSCQIIPKTQHGIKKRLVVTTLGGLIINLIFVIFGIVAVAVDAVPTYLAMVAPASLYLFVINILPVETVTGKTDGLLVAEVLNNEDSAKVMLAVLTVQAQILNGKPIEEVDQKLLFDLPQIQEDDPAFISLTELRAEYFSAKGDSEKAQKYQSRFEQLKQDYLN